MQLIAVPRHPCRSGRFGARRAIIGSAPKEFLPDFTNLFQTTAIVKRRKNFTRFLFINSALALLFAFGALSVSAQTAEGDSDSSAEAVKLFNQGQDAHARGELTRALELYDAALKIRAEFPEAEYQRAAALISLNRLAEAETSLRRAIALRQDWALPLIALAKLRARAGANKEAVELIRRATEIEKENASIWAERGALELKSGDIKAADESLSEALRLNPNEINARIARSDARTYAKDFAGAIADMQSAQSLAQEKSNIELSSKLTLQLAKLYAFAGKIDEAQRALDALNETNAPPAVLAEAKDLRRRLALQSETDPAKERAALEELAARDPQNAQILARLGALTRRSDPEKSLQYFRRAAELDPRNIDYAVGYAAALVQTRRFDAAANILRKIVKAAPDNYAAHTNLATALDELKDFRGALDEYEWINRARPELAITYFFIARAHDMLGEYPEALAAYEIFLQRADAQTNQLEIDKVNLRLPSLRNQIKRGEGAKKKKN
jgi:tetratricopeptide (TPR) repeat protein